MQVQCTFTVCVCVCMCTSITAAVGSSQEEAMTEAANIVTQMAFKASKSQFSQELMSTAKERPTAQRKQEQRYTRVCGGFLSPYLAEVHTVT